MTATSRGSSLGYKLAQVLVHVVSYRLPSFTYSFTYIQLVDYSQKPLINHSKLHTESYDCTSSKTLIHQSGVRRNFLGDSEVSDSEDDRVCA